MGSFDQGSFCIQIDDIAESMLENTALCATSGFGSPEGFESSYKGWRSLLSANTGRKLGFQIRRAAGAGGASYSNSKMDIYTGVIRQGANKIYFMNRAISPRKNGSFSGPFDVRIFFPKSERLALPNYDPAANELANLRITRDPEYGCNSWPTGNNNILITPYAYGGNGNVEWVEFTTDDFSTFFIHTGNTPLPVHTVNFSASALDRQVKLVWNITPLWGLTTYWIERSRDMKVWEIIHMENSVKENNFTWIDSSPLPGTNYYRIGYVDDDEVKNYTQVRSVNLDKPQLTVYPNPVTERIFIDSPIREIAEIIVYNSMMQPVYRQQAYSADFSTNGVDVAV